MSAWLVFWLFRTFGHHTAKESDVRESPNGDFDIWTIPLDWVVVVLNYRRSQEYVRDLVELLFNTEELSLEGRLAYAKSTQNAVSRAMFNFSGDVCCGSNPILFGWRVKDLRTMLDKDGNERLTFKKRKQDPELIQELSRIMEVTRKNS
jgi:hypothetical protein